MKSKTIWLFVAVGTGIISCAPVRFLPSEREYRCSAPFIDPTLTNEFLTGFTGRRDYKNGVTQFTHQFNLDSNDDYVRVCIHDRAGVSPGSGYTLTLKNVDKNYQPINENKNWTLVVANGGQTLLRDQCFEGRTSGGEFDVANPSTINGYWVISKTDRAITADLQIYSKNSVVADTALEPSCQLY